MHQRANGIVNCEDGASMVEYGLMIGLIALVCVVAVASIGTNLNGFFNLVAHTV